MLVNGTNPAATPARRVPGEVAWLAAFAILATGFLVWLWFGGWRWLATAVVLAFVVLVAVAVLTPKPPAK